MRRGMNGLALLVQEGFKRDPHAGDLSIFRRRLGNLVKVLWHDALGMEIESMPLFLTALNALTTVFQPKFQIGHRRSIGRPRSCCHPDARTGFEMCANLTLAKSMTCRQRRLDSRPFPSASWPCAKALSSSFLSRKTAVFAGFLARSY